MNKLSTSALSCAAILSIILSSCAHQLKPATATENQIELIVNYQRPTRMIGYQIEKSSIIGDVLNLDILYAGGCGSHTFQLIGDSSIMKTNPIKTNIYLIHTSSGDTCMREQKKTLNFNIEKLKKLKFNPIELNLDNIITISYKYEKK